MARRRTGRRREVTATPAQHFSGRTLSDRDRTLWASWVVAKRRPAHLLQRRLGLLPAASRQIGERFGGFDMALMENGAYDTMWPAVHMTPEQSVQAFEDLRGKVFYLGAQQHLRPGVPHLARPAGPHR